MTVRQGYEIMDRDGCVITVSHLPAEEVMRSPDIRMFVDRMAVEFKTEGQDIIFNDETDAVLFHLEFFSKKSVERVRIGIF
jgi:hypothetical protein